MLRDAWSTRRRPGGVTRVLVWFIVLFCVTQAPLPAGTREAVAVSSQDGIYRIRLAMVLDVPAPYVCAVLTDYRHIYRLNPSIIESRVLPPPGDGATRVYTRMRGCVGFYCKEFARVEDVREREDGVITTRIVPEPSDFHGGAAEWRVDPQGDRTRLLYTATVEPAFAIPPLLGTYFVEQRFRAESLATFAKIERVAQVRFGIEMASGLAKYARLQGPGVLLNPRDRGRPPPLFSPAGQAPAP